MTATAYPCRPVRLLLLLSLTTVAALASGTVARGAVGALPPLHLSSNVAVIAAQQVTVSQPVVAEAPDGTVYVATLTGGRQTVWASPRAHATRIVERIPGAGVITALAADATYLYVGQARGVTSYRRSTGTAVRFWPLSHTPAGLTDLVVAGNRVWGLLTPVDLSPAPGHSPAESTLVELDPTKPTTVRTLRGLEGTLSLVASHSAVFFVTHDGASLVRLTNAGVRTKTPTHQVTNPTLSGPFAVQALMLVGNTLVLDAQGGADNDFLWTYDASTLAGPRVRTQFTVLGEIGTTSVGVLAVGYSGDSGQCPNAEPVCLRRYSLTSGPTGPRLALPAGDITSTVLGPYPALVLQERTAMRVLRFS